MKEQLILGFDFGIKYIGVAVGQSITCSARPLTAIKVKNQIIDWLIVDDLINTWRPSQLIVGIPWGETKAHRRQAITKQSLQFFNNLKQRYNLPIDTVNEHLSTWEAKKELILAKNHYNSKELIDINATAAAILVKQWLNSLHIQ